MFKLRYFPNAWKTAVVIPILKPGKNPKLAESHRPISLLPILSKLADKIISTRLNDFLESENILVQEQHGFRPRLSTNHQILRVVEYIKDGIDRNQYTVAVFLDIQKSPRVAEQCDVNIQSINQLIFRKLSIEFDTHWPSLQINYL
ncbi:probable RNA-directed DNA polymerase from transposon X-element [Trichonephila clavipes]|nr:probable RNA-directed DNA polymerase from transposon X-element [Trichonephila clavipes]